MVIYLQQGATDLHMHSRCHCHPIISCFIKIQITLTFLVLAYSGCPGKEAIKWVFVILLDSQHANNRVTIKLHIHDSCY